MLLVDDSGKCVDANRAASEIFGMPREQLLGREPTNIRRFHYSPTPNIVPGIHLWVLREVSASGFSHEPFRQ